MQASIRIMPWTSAEDETLLKLIEEFGQSRWKLIGEQFRLLAGSARTNLQCRERFFNHLYPGIKKGHWTQVEKEVIFHWHRVYANQWAKIAKHLPSRTENSIKCFFNSEVKKTLKELNNTNSAPCLLTQKALVRDPNTTILLRMGQGSKNLIYQWCLWWSFCLLAGFRLNYS